MMEESDLVQAVSRAYGERVSMEQALEVARSEEKPVKFVSFVEFSPPPII